MKLPTLPSLEYNVTRRFTLAYLSHLIYGGGIIWIILITILNVAAVGYDVVPVYSTSFDNPAPLWYERFSGLKWLFPSSWSCNPTVIAPYQFVYTSIGFALYNLIAVIDDRPIAPISVDGLLYGNYALQNCSVMNITISVPNSDSTPQLVALVGCNTSIGQYFIAESTMNPFTTNQIPSPNAVPPLPQNSFWTAWFLALSENILPLGTAAPMDKNGSILPFEYFYIDRPSNNSCIACNSWQLVGVYDYTDADQFTVSVEYLPGGKIQNLILPSSLQVENEDDPWSQKDFWNYLGLLFETVYWAFLADFGQISPTEYPKVSDAVNLGNFSTLDFSMSETLPSMNNIFVNSSFYQVASSTGTESLLSPSFWQVPTFNNAKNLPLMTNETVFIQSYLCETRRLKSPFSLFITVVVADYALIVGAYNFVLWIAVIIEKRRKKNGGLEVMPLDDSNIPLTSLTYAYEANGRELMNEDEELAENVV